MSELSAADMKTFMAETLARGGVTPKMIDERATLIQGRSEGMPRANAFMQASAYFMALCLMQELLATKMAPMLEDYPFEDRLMVMVRGEKSFSFSLRCADTGIMDDVVKTLEGVLAKHGATMTNKAGIIVRQDGGEATFQQETLQ